MKMTQGFKEELFGSTDLKQSPMNIFKDKKQGFIEELHKSKDSRYPLQEPVKLLVEKDTSWHANINSQAIGSSKTKVLEIELSPKKYGQESQEKEGKISQERKGQKLEEKKVQNSQENEGQNFRENEEQNSNELKKSDESPLFLAIISNIQELVQEILIYHPHMLVHTNKEGMNILQVAILYRHVEIFEMVVESEVLPRSLVSAIDKNENSLLHMVSQKIKSQASERMQNPAFQLRKELLLFQKVKSACKMHLTKPPNKDHQTAEELFAASNEKLHQEAKEWLMRASENCTTLSVFIATVAFAAAYTVPGGSDGSTGILILHSKPFFVVFILADVISLTFALTSTGIFLSILTSSFPLQDFKTYLFKKLTLGIKCMFLSVSSMAVAFGATIVLIMTHNREKVVWYVVAFLPVPIFFLSYSPLRSAVLGRCTESFTNFVAKYLKVVGIVVAIFLFVLFYLLYKACEFIICKPVCWICGNKSQPNSDTQSPQQTAADPLPQV